MVLTPWVGGVGAGLVSLALFVAVNAVSRSRPVITGALVGGVVWTWLALWSPGGLLAAIACHIAWTVLMITFPRSGLEHGEPGRSDTSKPAATDGTPQVSSAGSVMVLFTRDLRVHNHPELAEASDRTGGQIVPLFVIDPALVTRSPNRTHFLMESLLDLDRSLATRGGGLAIRWGDPATLLHWVRGEVDPRLALACRS